MPKRYGQACPVAKSLEVIGDRWTLLLVREAAGVLEALGRLR